LQAQAVVAIKAGVGFRIGCRNFLRFEESVAMQCIIQKMKALHSKKTALGPEGSKSVGILCIRHAAGNP
jgi:hypothetical protein